MGHWDIMLHMENTDKPDMEETGHNHLCLHLESADRIYPSLTIFAQTPTQRAWVAAMAAASAAFWAEQAKKEIEG